MIGNVTGYRIGKNQDGDKDVLLLQVEISDKEDVQTVELFTQSGEDSNPPEGSRVIIASINENWKAGIAVDDGITPSMLPGEKKFYSISSGAISAFMNFLETGVLELNGNADFAVRFNALNTALQTMLTALNADIVTAGGAGTTTLDITPARVDEVKVK